jgi:hypothetical protein
MVARREREDKRTMREGESMNLRSSLGSRTPPTPRKVRRTREIVLKMSYEPNAPEK